MPPFCTRRRCLPGSTAIVSLSCSPGGSIRTLPSLSRTCTVTSGSSISTTSVPSLVRRVRMMPSSTTTKRRLTATAVATAIFRRRARRRQAEKRPRPGLRFHALPDPLTRNTGHRRAPWLRGWHGRGPFPGKREGEPGTAPCPERLRGVSSVGPRPAPTKSQWGSGGGSASRPRSRGLGRAGPPLRSAATPAAAIGPPPRPSTAAGPPDASPTSSETRRRATRARPPAQSAARESATRDGRRSSASPSRRQRARGRSEDSRACSPGCRCPHGRRRCVSNACSGAM